MGNSLARPAGYWLLLGEAMDFGGIGSGPPTISELCKLIKFLIEAVSIETYVETSSEHLPSLFQVMVRNITSNLDTIGGLCLTECLKTVRIVLARVQPAWNGRDVTLIHKQHHLHHRAAGSCLHTGRAGHHAHLCQGCTAQEQRCGLRRLLLSPWSHSSPRNR